MSADERPGDMLRRAAIEGRLRGRRGTTESNGDRTDADATPPLLERWRSSLLSAEALTRLPPVDWLVERVLPRHGIGVLYGPPKVAKTFVANDLTLSIGSGRRWFGWMIADPGPCLYVAGEGARGLGQRTDVWFRHHRIPASAVTYLPVAVQLLATGSIDLLVTLIVEHLPTGLRLIVIDTLARSMVGGDENTAQDMGKVVAALDALAERTGAFVLVVHHMGKNTAAGMRGSSALLGAVDTAIELTGSPDAFRLAVTAQKDATTPDPWWGSLKPVEPSAVAVPLSAADHPAESALACVAELRAICLDGSTVPNSSWKASCLEIGISVATFNRAVKWLVEHDWVTRSGTERATRYQPTSTTPDLPE